jgi:hypothetical protein
VHDDARHSTAAAVPRPLWHASGPVQCTLHVVASAQSTPPTLHAPLVPPLTAARYRVVNATDIWPQAEAACEADGVAHLAIPNDPFEYTTLATLLVNQNVWLGITDRITVGTFLTVTGVAPPYANWDTGEPTGAAAECVQIDGVSTRMKDQGCTSGRRFICECDGAAASPTAY